MAVLTTGRLPVRLTPLVGRESELGEVTRALAGCRLFTLTGPGGAKRGWRWRLRPGWPAR